MVKNAFEKNSALWVRYDDYEWVSAEDGSLYIMPVKGAAPDFYNPFRESDQLVTDTVDTAEKCYIFRENDETLKSVIKKYICKYGLMGIMTALPATVSFTDYEKVFLPKNIVIRDGVMDTERYLDLFFPFERPDLEHDEDPNMILIEQMFALDPYEVQLVLMPQYAERFDWLKKLFRDWAFLIRTVAFAREDPGSLDAQAYAELYLALRAFKGNAPTYHFYLADQPEIRWDFNSLMLVIQMMYSQMLVGGANSIRLCRRCGKPFVARSANAKYCSKECREKSTKYNQDNS